MAPTLKTAWKTIEPWLLPIAVAVGLTFFLTRGFGSVEPQHRPLPPLAGRLLGSAAMVTNQTLAGKPAILAAWAPG